jgi:hypothetical protein
MASKMTYNRATIGRYLLVMLVTLLSFSFSSSSSAKAATTKDSQIVKLQENIEIPETNVLRSGTEIVTAVFKISSDFNFSSSENFFSKSVQIHLAHFQVEEKRIHSSFKIYLQFLRILV